MEVSRGSVEEAVQERIARMGLTRLDILQVNIASFPKTTPELSQFHWNDYNNSGYMAALDHLNDMRREGVIGAMGLVNFDTIRTDAICTSLGREAIVSNQVQARLCYCLSYLPCG
jgi:diketogulonate reductase-like aldo/keto reductase